MDSLEMRLTVACLLIAGCSVPAVQGGGDKLTPNKADGEFESLLVPNGESCVSSFMCPLDELCIEGRCVPSESADCRSDAPAEARPYSLCVHKNHPDVGPYLAAMVEKARDIHAREVSALRKFAEEFDREPSDEDLHMFQATYEKARILREEVERQAWAHVSQVNELAASIRHSRIVYQSATAMEETERNFGYASHMGFGIVDKPVPDVLFPILRTEAADFFARRGPFADPACIKHSRLEQLEAVASTMLVRLGALRGVASMVDPSHSKIVPASSEPAERWDETREWLSYQLGRTQRMFGDVEAELSGDNAHDRMMALIEALRNFPSVRLAVLLERPEFRDLDARIGLCSSFIQGFIGVATALLAAVLATDPAAVVGIALPASIPAAIVVLVNEMTLDVEGAGTVREKMNAGEEISFSTGVVSYLTAEERLRLADAAIDRLRSTGRRTLPLTEGMSEVFALIDDIGQEF